MYIWWRSSSAEPIKVEHADSLFVSYSRWSHEKDEQHASKTGSIGVNIQDKSHALTLDLIFDTSG